jgi:hypothetical protein
LVQSTKKGKIYHITSNYTKPPLNITKDCKLDKVSIKYTNIFHCKTLQNLPRFGFLVWKQTIWQPWLAVRGKKWKNRLRKVVKKLICPPHHL